MFPVASAKVLLEARRRSYLTVGWTLILSFPVDRLTGGNDYLFYGKRFGDDQLVDQCSAAAVDSPEATVAWEEPLISRLVKDGIDTA